MDADLKVARKQNLTLKAQIDERGETMSQASGHSWQVSKSKIVPVSSADQVKSEVMLESESVLEKDDEVWEMVMAALPPGESADPVKEAEWMV